MQNLQIIGRLISYEERQYNQNDPSKTVVGLVIATESGITKEGVPFEVTTKCSIWNVALQNKFYNILAEFSNNTGFALHLEGPPKLNPYLQKDTNLPKATLEMSVESIENLSPYIAPIVPEIVQQQPAVQYQPVQQQGPIAHQPVQQPITQSQHTPVGVVYQQPGMPPTLPRTVQSPAPFNRPGGTIPTQAEIDALWEISK